MSLTSTQKRLLNAEFALRFERACQKIRAQYSTAIDQWRSQVLDQLTKLYPTVNLAAMSDDFYGWWTAEKLAKYFPNHTLPPEPPEPAVPLLYGRNNPAAHEFALTLEFMDGGLDDLNKTMDTFISDWLTKYAENRS